MQWVVATYISGLILGVVCTDALRPVGEEAWSSGWFWGSLGIQGLLCVAWWASIRRRVGLRWTWLCWGLAGVALGVGLHATSAVGHEGLPARWLERGSGYEVRVAGVVERGERVAQEGRRVVVMRAVRCDGVVCSGVLRVVLPKGSERVEVGERVVVRGVLRWPAPYRDAPYLFDEQRWMVRQGLAATVRVREARWVVRLEKGRRVGLDGWRRGRERWVVGVLGEERAALVLALVTGSRGLIRSARRRGVDTAGLSHLLAISGLHVMTLAGVVLWLVRAVGRWRPRWAVSVWGRGLASLAVVGVVVWYGALAGWPVSAQRAAVMLVCCVVASLVGRGSSFVVSLALAVGWVVVMDSTHAVFDVGLQLSVCAVVGIGLGVQGDDGLDELAVLQEVLRREDGEGEESKEGATRGAARMWELFKGVCWTGLRVTWWTNAACLVWMMLYFGRVPLLGALLNLIAVPIVQCISLPAALLACVVGEGVVGGWLLEISSVSLGWVEWMAGVCPWSGVGVGVVRMEWVLVGVLTASGLVGWRRDTEEDWARWRMNVEAWGGGWRRGLFWVVEMFGKRKGAAGLWCLVVACVLASWPSTPESHEVWFLPVGQGDSMVFRARNGRTLLLDAPGTFGGRDAGWDVVRPALHRMGVRRLWGVGISHGDLDHIGGLVSVVEEFRPAYMFWNAPRGVSASERRLLHAAQRVGTRILDYPDRFELDEGFVFERVDPRDVYGFRRALPKNDRSAVLRVHIGALRMLLTGDVEELAEWGLDPSRLRAHLLKVGHHGSRTSTSPEFLHHVNPTWAIIQAGRENRFGHPHNDVLLRLHDAGIRTLSTASCGLIHLRIQPDALDFTLHAPCSYESTPNGPTTR